MLLSLPLLVFCVFCEDSKKSFLFWQKGSDVSLTSLQGREEKEGLCRGPRGKQPHEYKKKNGENDIGARLAPMSFGGRLSIPFEIHCIRIWERNVAL